MNHSRRKHSTDSQGDTEHFRTIEKILLGSPRRRWEENIRKDLKEIGVKTKNLIHLIQERDY